MTQTAVTSADGTTIAAWSNGGDGIPLLICNGLASVPPPGPPCATRTAASTPARGSTGASHRLLGAARRRRDVRPRGRCSGRRRGRRLGPVLGGRLVAGVNIALELAAVDDRVAGVLALAGVPGGSAQAMLPVASIPAMSRCRWSPSRRRCCRPREHYWADSSTDWENCPPPRNFQVHRGDRCLCRSDHRA